MNRLQTNYSSRTAASNFDCLEFAKNNIADRALEIQANLSTMCAFEYLKSNDVDADVIWLILKPGVNVGNKIMVDSTRKAA